MPSRVLLTNQSTNRTGLKREITSRIPKLSKQRAYDHNDIPKTHQAQVFLNCSGESLLPASVDSRRITIALAGALAVCLDSTFSRPSATTRRACLGGSCAIRRLTISFSLHDARKYGSSWGQGKQQSSNCSTSGSDKVATVSQYTVQRRQLLIIRSNRAQSTIG